VLDQFWLWSMQSGLKNAYESIMAFSETDFTEDLEKFDDLPPELATIGTRGAGLSVRASRGQRPVGPGM
jgi:hypothetical protein